MNKEGLDYKPTVKKTNIIKKLIKKESRFMMGQEPEIKLAPKNEADKDAVTQMEKWLADMLRRERWPDKLIKGARDCFIGKRVALKLTGGPNQPLGIQFRPSLEFVYDTDPENVDQLTKVIFFYQTNESQDKGKQRIWRQRFEMVEGRCVLTEGEYDGYGVTIKETHKEEDTGLDFIPVFVIINDGLTGDMTGESDVAELIDDQDTYNRLKSDDVDALRFNMFPMRVFKDATQETVDSVKIAPGAMIDAQTDPASGNQVGVEMVEAHFSYDARAENTLNRTKSDLFDLLSVPNVSPDELKGFITSGKSMKALYWDLIDRCEEKWNAWDAALIWMTDALVKMARLFSQEKPPDVPYTVTVDHRYPIPDDEEIERQGDMQEVAQQVRSRKSYIEKWMPEADADAELMQIALEKKLLEDDFTPAVRSEIETPENGPETPPTPEMENPPTEDE